MKRRVVIAGWGQVTQGKEQRDSLLDPLGLITKAARQAAEAAGGIDLLRRLDAVMVVRVLSRHYTDAAAELSRDIGAAPRLKRVSGIGGSSPQVLINQAAGMIARGELDSVLWGPTICRMKSIPPRERRRSRRPGNSRAKALLKPTLCSTPGTAGPPRP